MKFYTGVGSRRTPDDVLALMRQLALRLAADGWTLRSGHAPGADQAFEEGAGEYAEVFLPWATFEQHVPLLARSVSTSASDEAFAIAAEHHPGWAHCSNAARMFHARNCHQVLGASLTSPSSFLVCWTPDGSLDGRGRDSGGTGQALRIAAAYRVRTFNLAVPEHRDRVEAMCRLPFAP